MMISLGLVEAGGQESHGQTSSVYYLTRLNGSHQKLLIVKLWYKKVDGGPPRWSHTKLQGGDCFQVTINQMIFYWLLHTDKAYDNDHSCCCWFYVMSREELNMHSLTLIPDNTLTLVAKMVFVQVWIMGMISRIILQRWPLFLSGGAGALWTGSWPGFKHPRVSWQTSALFIKPMFSFC